MSMTETVAAQEQPQQPQPEQPQPEKPQPCISFKCYECERYPEILDYILGPLHKELIKKGCCTRVELKTFWFVFIKLCYRGITPSDVCVEEGYLMRSLHKDGYSMSELAFIFDRSKSTVSENIKKIEDSLGK